VETGAPRYVGLPALSGKKWCDVPTWQNTFQSIRISLSVQAIAIGFGSSMAKPEDSTLSLRPVAVERYFFGKPLENYYQFSPYLIW